MEFLQNRGEGSAGRGQSRGRGSPDDCCDERSIQNKNDELAS
jgi:hypothetical protein